MKIDININIELNKEEIQLLRKYYTNGKTSKQFLGIPNRNTNVEKEPGKEYNIVKILTEKEILIKDNMMNFKLSIIGKIVVDKIDRDKIINNILE